MVHAFIEVDISPETFVERLGANHMHAAPDDYIQELLHFCAMIGIEPVLSNGA